MNTFRVRLPLFGLLVVLGFLLNLTGISGCWCLGANCGVGANGNSGNPAGNPGSGGEQPAQPSTSTLTIELTVPQPNNGSGLSLLKAQSLTCQTHCSGAAYDSTGTKTDLLCDTTTACDAQGNPDPGAVISCPSSIPEGFSAIAALVSCDITSPDGSLVTVAGAVSGFSGNIGGSDAFSAPPGAIASLIDAFAQALSTPQGQDDFKALLLQTCNYEEFVDFCAVLAGVVDEVRHEIQDDCTADSTDSTPLICQTLGTLEEEAGDHNAVCGDDYIDPNEDCDGHSHRLCSKSGGTCQDDCSCQAGEHDGEDGDDEDHGGGDDEGEDGGGGSECTYESNTVGPIGAEASDEYNHEDCVGSTEPESNDDLWCANDITKRSTFSCGDQATAHAFVSESEEVSSVDPDTMISGQWVKATFDDVKAQGIDIWETSGVGETGFVTRVDVTTGEDEGETVTVWRRDENGPDNAQCATHPLHIALEESMVVRSVTVYVDINTTTSYEEIDFISLSIDHSEDACFCGDGHQDEGEDCDDGNTDNGDGCDDNCHTEAVCTNVESSDEYQCLSDDSSTDCEDEQDSMVSRWDPEECSGDLDDGNDDSYDSMYYLTVNDTEYDGCFTHFEDHDREYVFQTVTMSGLDVHRKLMAPAAGGGFARYLEILHNPTEDPITVTITISGNLGSDSDTTLIQTSNEDTNLLDTSDFWLVTDDDCDGCDDASLAHVWDGPEASDHIDFVELSEDDLSYGWGDVQIDPGQTVIYMHFPVQAPNNEAAIAKAGAVLSHATGVSITTGMSATEISQVRNWSLEAPSEEDCSTTCGNDVTEGDEECDDGNTENGDGCDASCHSEESGGESTCGNGDVEGEEECDNGEGNTESCSYGETECTVCNLTCHEASGSTSYCGDGEVDGDHGEDCDDGANGVICDGCDDTCHVSVCFD